MCKECKNKKVKYFKLVKAATMSAFYLFIFTFFAPVHETIPTFIDNKEMYVKYGINLRKGVFDFLRM